MSVAKIIELSAESPTSFEDAIVQGITKASKTVHGIKSARVKEQDVVIENGKVALFRVDLKDICVGLTTYEDVWRESTRSRGEGRLHKAPWRKSPLAGFSATQ